MPAIVNNPKGGIEDFLPRKSNAYLKPQYDGGNLG